MIKKLREYFFRHEMVEGDSLVKMLGSEARVKEMASLWEQHGTELEMIAAVGMHDWVTKRAFDKAEVSAFKEGLAIIPVVLAQCCAKRIHEENTKSEN